MTTPKIPEELWVDVATEKEPWYAWARADLPEEDGVPLSRYVRAQASSRPLFMQALIEALREEGEKFPTVDAIYVRQDGLEFVMTGCDYSPEMYKTVETVEDRAREITGGARVKGGWQQLGAPVESWLVAYVKQRYMKEIPVPATMSWAKPEKPYGPRALFRVRLEFLTADDMAKRHAVAVRGVCDAEVSIVALDAEAAAAAGRRAVRERKENRSEHARVLSVEFVEAVEVVNLNERA